MLSITTKSPYAVRALTELARCGGAGPVPIGELARRRDVPVQFLEQLVTVLEVVELLDGRLGADAEGIFGDAATAARTVLAKATIADILERENRAAGAQM